MRTRTKLTTPPGQEPVDDATDATGETYEPAFELPREPHVPSRYRGVAVWTTVVVLLAAVAWLGFRVASTGQAEDPSLDQPVGELPSPSGDATP